MCNETGCHGAEYEGHRNYATWAFVQEVIGTHAKYLKWTNRAQELAAAGFKAGKTAREVVWQLAEELKDAAEKQIMPMRGDWRTAILHSEINGADWTGVAESVCEAAGLVNFAG